MNFLISLSFDSRFPNDMEASFSTYRMWNSIGMASAFYASAHWKWHAKVLTLLFLVTSSAIGYVILLLSDYDDNEMNIDGEGEGRDGGVTTTTTKSCSDRMVALLCPLANVAEEEEKGKRRQIEVEGDDSDLL